MIYQKILKRKSKGKAAIQATKKIKKEVRAEYLQSEEFKTFKQALEASYKNTAQNSSVGYPHTGLLNLWVF